MFTTTLFIVSECLLCYQLQRPSEDCMADIADSPELPEDIRKRAEVGDEKLLYTAKSDINEKDQYGERWLLITPTKIIIVGETVKKYDLSQIKSIDAVDHLGMGELLAEVDGKKVRLITFSKTKAEDFRKAVVLVSELMDLKGKSLTLKIEKPKRRKSNTYGWLFAFLKPYKLQLGLLLFFSVTGIIASLIPPYLIGMLINEVFTAHKVYMLVPIVLATMGAYAFGTALGIGSSYFLNWLGQRIIYDMRGSVYSHLQRLSLDFYDRMSSGRVLSRVVDDVGRVQWFLSSGIQSVVVNSLTLVGIGVIIFLMNWRLALFVLLPVPVIVFGIPLYRRRAHALYHRAWRKWADVDTLLVDTIPGIVVVKSFSQEDREINRLKDKMGDVVISNMDTVKLNLSFFPLLGFATSISAVSIYYFGGLQVLGGTLSLGTLIAFTMYMGQFYGPINSLTNLFQPMQQAVTSAERVMEIMQEEPQVKDSPDAVDLDIKGDIAFSGVSFGYEPYLPVVYNVSFHVLAGTTLGVVGPSGAGKTTLTKLLMRFYDPQSGAIYVDGVDLRKIKRSSWRKQVGIVLQDPFLFDGSVAYNISYGLKHVEPEKIVASAKAAAAHDFIMKLPLAYDNWVGERGSQLSGGERQRVAIARAIITDPRVLVMDEATSSVDSITEKQIQKAIDNMVKDRTTIIIAHRLSTIKHAHNIIVMNHGTVAESGTHEELIKKNGLYARMYRVQYEEEEEEEKKAINVTNR